MKFEHTKVMNFDGAIRGMRNPKNSWDKSDSYINDEFIIGGTDFMLCEEDEKLARKLIKAGTEHRKFMRQIFVSVDITAPLYWWKEFDQYKISVTTNSCSTMHKLATTPITLDCFETDDYEELSIMMNDGFRISTSEKWEDEVNYLEQLRLNYNATKDKRYWKELIRRLPSSWLQKRTVTMDYENLLAMCSRGQRRFHKLNEWSGVDNKELPNLISWARTLPYSQELLFLDELEENT